MNPSNLGLPAFGTDSEERVKSGEI
jgi:hypothetical protein